MTDARDIVERDHIKETTETLFRIAINATMPKENEAKWCQALQYAGAMLEKQQADLASLRKQLEDARGSLYQCYRSSRDDALESHPDWAEHIADINRESGEAIARIDEAMKGKS